MSKLLRLKWGDCPLLVAMDLALRWELSSLREWFVDFTFPFYPFSYHTAHQHFWAQKVLVHHELYQTPSLKIVLT